MAETAVGLVVVKLIPLLTEEANLLRGIHKEVNAIKRELQSILAFLKDADRRSEAEGNNMNNGVKVWVEELREAAFQIDDVIDEYTHLMAHQQRQHKHKFVGFLRNIACLIVELKPRHDIASKVQELKKTVREINERRATYDFSSTEQGSSSVAQSQSWYDPRKDSCFLKETEVVGIESARDELIKVLEGTFPRRSVISVVGMGGLGKTTLAHQVYDRVKGYFDCHAWIEVSQSYDKVKLLQELIKKFFKARKEPIPEEVGAMDETTTTTKLRDYLQGKSYLVIFDDVWSINFWDFMKNALPDSYEKSGRIIITTRLTEVANSCKKSSFVHIHHLQPLPPDKAWELFCNKAFQYELEGNCPTYLDKLSHEIVERCQGLPLAIAVIAGLLSTKNKTVDEWRKLLTSLSSELECNEHLTSIKKILSLSYNDLLYNLKPCFLYCGIFPEDYSIRPKGLIRQWIAEGFVKPKKDKTLEVVAEEYLVELINRNLVQVPQVDFDGKARICRIHDLLREIILNKMEELSFCQVLSGKDSHFKGLTRRISIINTTHDVIMSSTFEISHIRSIFVFDKDKMPNHVISAITTNFKLLKVLDFKDAPNLDYLPEDIGSFFHLKYLSVQRTKVAMLPKSIGKLENLETLDMKESLVFELPAAIKRLSKLRYISAYHSDIDSFSNRKAVKVERGIGQLKALQKLFYIEASIEVDIFKELCKLTELRKLGITKLKSEDGNKLCDCIQKMNHLQSLEIYSISEDEIIDLECMTFPPRFLQHLSLHGRLRKLPEYITNLQNIVRIMFRWSRLEDDPLKVLQNLHNLLDLWISDDGYYGETLHFKEGTFSKLKVLRLCSLSKLRLLVIEEGALCNLEEFFFGPCPQLKELLGFKHLRNLKEVFLDEMSIKLLMFQNFQSLQSTGVHIRFGFKIRGAGNIKLEWVTEILESLRGLDQEEWESEFKNMLSKRLTLT